MRRKERRIHALLWPLLALVLAIVISASLIARGALQAHAERELSQDRL